MLEENPVEGYPLTAGQERELLKRLSGDRKKAAILSIHTGVREHYLRELRWDDELFIRGLNTSVFNIDNKNGERHRMVLNSIAKDIIESCRGNHPDYVFSYPARNRSTFGAFEKGGDQGNRKPYASSFSNWSFREAVVGAGLGNVRGEGHNFRWHDFRHTFATRLAAMGVHPKTVKDMMGHKTGDITAHYTAQETTVLIEAAEKLVDWYKVGPEFYVRSTKQAA